jgi:FAD/FMN-containing dehydrogenase
VSILRRGDPGYEAARLDAVWNARKPHRYPAAILLADTAEDVAAGVRLARAEGLRVGIRSGGHSFVGNGVRDDCLLIDLSRLTGVGYDPDTGIARVEPAACGPQVNALLARYGRYFPSGHAPTVGTGGYILGGGYGWASRKWGPACLSIEAIDVVLADGELVHADDRNHPDLLWAARGCGPGFFGVVTAFHLRTYPASRRILRTAHTFPMELRDEVLGWSHDILPGLPPEVEMSAKVGRSPGSGEHTVSLTATAFVGADCDDDVLAVVETVPVRDRAIRSLVAADSTLAELYDLADALTPKGLRWSFDGIWCGAPASDVLAAAKPMFESIPVAGISFVLWMLWGGYPLQDNACWSVQAPLYLSPNAGCHDPADDLVHEAWAHGGLRDIQHLSAGVQFSDNNLADRWDHGLSPDNAARLEQIRHRYDPDGLFHSYMAPAESTTALARYRRVAT